MTVTTVPRIVGDIPLVGVYSYPPMGDTLEGQALAIARKYSASVYLPSAGSYVTGAELVTNGDFSNGTTGWSAVYQSTISAVAGKLRVTSATGSNPYARQLITVVPGKTYRITAPSPVISDASTWWFYIGNTTTIYSAEYAATNTSAALAITIVATTTTLNFSVSSTAPVGQYADFDNISVREVLSVTGNTSDAALTTAAVNDGSVGGVVGQRIGPELVTNGDGTTLTGWTLSVGGTWNVAGGGLQHSGAASNISQAILTVGKTYTITYQVVSITTGTIRSYLGLGTALTLRSTAGTYTETGVCATNGTLYLDASLNSDVVIDNISVKELGYVATQPNANFKPTLIGGARNLLLWSEDFSNGIWTKSNSSVSANVIAAPDGTLTADKLVENTANSAHTLVQPVTYIAASHTFAIYAKAAGRDFLTVHLNGAGGGFACFNLASGVVGTVNATTATIDDAGNGWFRCSVTNTMGGGAAQVSLYLASADAVLIYTGDGTSGVYLWGAQLEIGSTASTYVQTTTATASSGANPKAWLFDGTDDRFNLSGPIISMAADHFVIAAAKNFSKTTQRVLVSHASTASNTPRVAEVSFTTSGYAQASWVDDAAGASTITGTTDLTNQVCVVSAVKQGNDKQLFVNGAQIGATNSTARGATTINAAALGATPIAVPANFESGNAYGRIIGNGTVTPAERLILEKYLAARGGFTL